MQKLISTSHIFKFIGIVALTLAFQVSRSQVPATYYDGAIGMTGALLKQELHDIITAGHVKLPYTSSSYDTWDAFATTDVYASPNNTIVWDMYSSFSNSYDGTAPYYFTIYTDQDNGTGSNEGEYYNREHSIPNSWWGGNDIFQYTDINMLFATDKIVNNLRANYPYGEVTAPSQTSLNGSKLGPNDVAGSGFTGTSFEPVDIYKGDFARAYFYAATRYKDEIPGWVSSYSGTTDVDVVFNSTGNFNTWYLNMLYQWHLNDPPSQKELDRNDAVYDAQGNANPYIDHPEWVCEVWFSGSCSATPTLAVTPTTISGLTYVFGNGPSAAQSFSLSGSGLTGYPSNITVTAPTNFEVSLSSGSGYAASVNVSYTSATLSATTIYVRLKTALAVNTYSGTVTLTGGGDTDGASVSVSGSVTAAVPTLTVTPTSLSGFTYVVGAGPSTQQSYTISGVYLTGYPSNITVTAPTNYEVSLTSGSGFAGSVSVAYASATLSATTIYVRLQSGLSAGTYGPVNVTNTGGGATSVNVALSGTVTSASSTCGTETFTNIPTTSTSSYLTRTWTGDGGGSWSATDARTDQTITGKAITIRNGVLTSPSTSGGIGDLTFKTKFPFSESSGSLTIAVNGTTVGTVAYADMTGSTPITKTISGIDVSGNVIITITSVTARFTIDDLSWTCYTPATPTITVSPTTLSGFTYQVGSGPSAEQSFTVSGSGLGGNISIVPPTDYEISTGTGVSFVATNPITLTQSGGTVSNTTIYVRLKSGLGIGTYNSESITASSTGATNQTVTCNGTVTGVPVITVAPTSLSGFTYVEGSGPSAEQSFTISGSYLTSNISIVPPTDYEISTGTAGAFVASNPITLTQSGGTVSNTPIYVRLKAGLLMGTYNSENITASSTGATNKTVTCNGTVTARPTITVTPTTLSGFTYVFGFGPSIEQSFTVSGVDLDADMSLIPPTDYEISTGTGVSFVPTNPITLTQSGGSVSATTIYVRLKAGLAIGNYNSEVITASTAGAINKTVTCSGTVTVPPSEGCATDLIISEYGEGSSNNKYIEVYNGTGASIDFSSVTYTLKQANAGGAWGAPYTLTGTLADNDVFILANTSANATILAVADATEASVTAFNGDDAIGLFKNDVLIDIVGNTTGDPGTGWAVAGITAATAEHTLVRKVFITGPETNWATSAGTDAASSEWVVYAADTWTYLDSHTMDCTCEEPTVHASNINFSTITATSMAVNWTSGNGTSRIVVAREGLPVNWTPTDLNTYAANASFGSGTELGTGNYVVYNGSGSSTTVTNLTAGSTYYFMIYEYGCAPGNEDYLTSGTAEEGHATTLPNDVFGLKINCATTSSMEINWSLPSGSYDAVLITILEGGTPENPTCDGSSLTNPLTDYGLADVYCGTSTAKYVFNGIGTNVSVTNLNPGASYTVKAFVYKNSSWSTGVSVTGTATVSDVTGLQANCGNTTSLLGWDNPNLACFDEVMVVAHTATIAGIPSGIYTANSSSYTDPLNPAIPGGGVVVYNGIGESVSITSLTNNTTYYFKVFVRSGSDWSDGTETWCTPSTAVVLNYGDLAIVGINTDITGLTVKPDEIQLVSFVSLTTGTSFDFTDNGYERLYPGLWADSEGTIRFTRTGADLPAGTVITIQGLSNSANPVLGTDYNIFVCGANDNTNWSVSSINNNTAGTTGGPYDLNVNDQIWIMQGGNWSNGGVLGDHDATYSGNVLYGWTAIGWEPSPGYDDTKGSTVFEGSGCATTNVAGKTYPDKTRYTGPITQTSQIGWIGRFNDPSNWTDYGDNPSYFAGGTLPCVILINYDVVSTQWTGVTNTDWDNCANWNILRVPDQSTDVVFDNTSCVNDIVIKAGEMPVCRNLTINGNATAVHFIKMEGDNTKILEIRGNLTINAPGLDMDDANSGTSDGIIDLMGNWINNLGTDGFLEGNSTVEMIGGSDQTITTIGASEDFWGLTVSNISASGVILNSPVTVNGNLNLDYGSMSLNSFDLIINGAYNRISGSFAGNAASDITVQGTGTLAPFYFSDPQVLNSFTMNRASTISALATNLTMNDLTITSGTVQLNAGKYFTVNTAISNALASGLLLKSDATGTASLIHYNEAVAAISERYVEGGAWSYVFPPLSAVPEGIMGGANPNFYWYNETPADYWNATTIYGTTGWTDVPGGALSTARGYIVYHPSTQVYNLTGGSLNYNIAAGNTVFTSSYSDSGTGPVNLDGVTADWINFEGWNLFGNPFTSAIDWDQTVKTNIENVVYYYDGSINNYRYYGASAPYNQGITVNGGSQFVPANQAFMVKATVNGGTLTIPNSARVHNALPFWKKSTELPVNIIRLEIENDGFKDETVVRSLPDATKEHDGLYDAYKMFSYDKSKPMLYSRAWDNSFAWAMNALPLPKEHEIVPLGVYVGQSNEYTIRITENSYEGIHVWLEDAFTKTEINLREQAEYAFSQSLMEHSERFYLHLGVNRAPKRMLQIPDQQTETGVLYSYTVPADLFIDDDFGDKLSIKADLVSGKALPEWLSFDAQTLQFVGTPDQEQRLEIRLTATDIFGAQAFESYVLDVKSVLDVKDAIYSVSVYPNPASDVITIDMTGLEKAECTITDLSGKELMNTVLVGERTTLDLSAYAKGIYFIVISSEAGEYRQKLILR
jgi:hypothetical protein